MSTRASIPPVDNAVKIATAMNTTVEYLVTGKVPNTTKYKPLRPCLTEIHNGLALLPEKDQDLMLAIVETLKKQRGK